jgi:hypothetical protein
MLIQHGSNLFSLCYFVDAIACLTDTIAGFADTVLNQPDEGLCRRYKHDVFIDSSPLFAKHDALLQNKGIGFTNNGYRFLTKRHFISNHLPILLIFNH